MSLPGLAMFIEAPDVLTGILLYPFAFLAGWQKEQVHLSEQFQDGFITGDLAGLAGCKFSQSEVAGYSKEVFQFKSYFLSSIN